MNSLPSDGSKTDKERNLTKPDKTNILTILYLVVAMAGGLAYALFIDPQQTEPSIGVIIRFIGWVAILLLLLLMGSSAVKLAEHLGVVSFSDGTAKKDAEKRSGVDDMK